MKAVHLFLNSAKSSQAGKRMEKSKVCAVMSPHESSRPLAAFISDGDPFKSHLTSTALSHSSWRERGAGAFCQHKCPCPFWVTTWEMGTHRNLRVSPKVTYIWNPSSGTEYQEHCFSHGTLKSRPRETAPRVILPSQSRTSEGNQSQDPSTRLSPLKQVR